MALSYVYQLMGKERLMKVLPLFTRSAQTTGPGGEKIRVLLQQMDKRMNSPLTSSCGRLFDGVSAMLGLCSSISFEGQAAMELEMIADREEDGDYEFILEPEADPQIIRLRPIIEGILLDLERGTSPSRISGKFHNTLVEIGKAVCEKIRGQGGPEKVTLSGGVFQNRLLLERMTTALEGAGFKVLTHRQVPCNDGGLSLGQAVIANFISI
jgi:hydrogenase maturation protein HypF